MAQKKQTIENRKDLVENVFVPPSGMEVCELTLISRAHQMLRNLTMIIWFFLRSLSLHQPEYGIAQIFHAGFHSIGYVRIQDPI